jgi:hypothetical protein
LRLATDEGVGLGTASQDFDRFGKEFSQEIDFPDVMLG